MGRKFQRKDILHVLKSIRFILVKLEFKRFPIWAAYILRLSLSSGIINMFVYILSWNQVLQNCSIFNFCIKIQFQNKIVMMLENYSVHHS